MSGVHSEIPTNDAEIDSYISALLKNASIQDALIQTSKQPVVWQCLNPACSEHPKRVKPFEFQSEYSACPKCGSKEPLVQKRALIHFLFGHPKGKITGQYGRKLIMACDHDRDYIATSKNGEAASGDFSVVNCPGCWDFIEKQFRGHESYAKIMELKKCHLLLGSTR